MLILLTHLTASSFIEFLLSEKFEIISDITRLTKDFKFRPGDNADINSETNIIQNLTIFLFPSFKLLFIA